MGAGVTRLIRASSDFDYLPVRPAEPFRREEHDFIIATCNAETPNSLAQALARARIRARVDEQPVRPPLFWFRVLLETPLLAHAVEDALRRAAIGVRYVTSSTRGSQALGARADFSHAPNARGQWQWPTRSPQTLREEKSSGRWFIDDEGGVAVDRAVCGYGAGTRLAVIDEDAGELDALAIDAVVLVGVITPPRGSSHGASMVAWTVGSRGRPSADIEPFVGVAPAASPRLYVIPRPGNDALSLPLAIIRAVDDGADVVLCATHVEGLTSPLLDDALEFALRVGRQGLGTAVVLPTGREVSSPPRSVHASLTLGLGDPASDPRVLCVAPSGRNGGWFLWADRIGKLRPFANRGPGIRVSAPGDDIAYPFSRGHRLGHAESSGASAIAAGVALLVLATNPELRLHELYELLAETAVVHRAATPGSVADAWDLLPSGNDADGHDSKCGYGRMSALRACLAAADPFAAALVKIGDDATAKRYLALRRQSDTLAGAYSGCLARWVTRVAGADSILSHAILTLVRHLRLVAGHPDRHAAHGLGALMRSLALVLDRIASHEGPSDVTAEVERLRALVLEATRCRVTCETLENALFALASAIWSASEAQGEASAGWADVGHRLAG